MVNCQPAHGAANYNFRGMHLNPSLHSILSIGDFLANSAIYMDLEYRNYGVSHFLGGSRSFSIFLGLCTKS
jgi:hypothetical protein